VSTMAVGGATASVVMGNVRAAATSDSSAILSTGSTRKGRVFTVAVGGTVDEVGATVVVVNIVEVVEVEVVVVVEVGASMAAVSSSVVSTGIVSTASMVSTGRVRTISLMVLSG